ncbi:MAG: VanZ family protein [Blautia obeum]|nr:VanZ family protein [Blautia obeum]
MDIYQIWTEYNNPWSSREILFFSGILIFTVIAVSYYLRKEKINKLQALAILAEVIFLGIVFASTVFTRTGSVRQYELIPFWSWRDIIRYHDRQLLKENLLNCILLFPAGALLPLIMNHKVKWQHALAFGVVVSAVIESSQLIMMRGLFEWDDMIHNGLGCMVGAVLVNWMIGFFGKKDER